jgi:peptidoglycan/xylan/chitin deacetylase (PgdA/CDA1 family)
MRSGSASTRAASALHDGLLVTRRAHAPDPRVPHAVPAHARGAPRSELAQAEYRHLAWVAGLAVAAGEDPTPALDAIPDPGRLPLQPTDMAGLLFAAVLVGRTVSPEQWVEVWPQVRAGAAAFLEAVEARTGSPGFAARTRRALAGLIVECSSRPLGAALEGVLDVEVDATRPVRVDLPPGASRIHARVRVGAIEIGRLTVPVLAGSDPGALLADEIDRRFAWPILAARDRLADGGRSPLVATLARVLPDTLAQGSSEALRRLHRRGHEWLERGLVRHRHSGTLTSASYVSVSRGANGSPGADPGAASVAETGADHPRPAGRGARHPAADAQLVIQRTLPPLRRALGRRAVAERLPILAYHRVAPSPDGASGRFQVDPERFERHLAFLRERGFRSVTLEDWQAAARGRLVLRGRPLVITFDDGYADFADIAAPLLRRYGFEAYVFVVTSLVGGTSCWDRHLGLEAPLLGWREMRALERDGVRFGSHTARHLPLAALEPEQIEREIRESRIALATRLERPSPSLAYPYGDVDDVVRFMARRIGVRFGLTTRCEPASRYHDALDLPRLEVFTWDDPADLAARIGLPATEVTG